MVEYLILLFILGLIFGSYLNVVIYRGSVKKSFVGRSKCTTCGEELKWLDLVPIVSFILSKAKCQYCSENISFRYPVVEILSGLIFIIPILFGFNLFDGLLFIITSYLLLGISVYDILHYELLDDLFNLLLLLVVIYVLFQIIYLGTYLPILFGFMLALPYFLIAFLSKEKAMGMGDAWIAFPTGALLGSYLEVFSVFLLSFWNGLLVIMIIYIFQSLKGKSNLGLKTQVPFLPFISLAYVITTIFGPLPFGTFGF